MIKAMRKVSYNPFFVASNGVTIKLKQGYLAGATGKADGDLSGTIYTAVDNTSLFAMDVNSDDYTSICTSLVTDMNSLFRDTSFNQDIGSWNVSSVINMNNLFRNTPFNQDLTSWCVEQIPSEPTDFATGSALTTANKPNWGATC